MFICKPGGAQEGNIVKITIKTQAQADRYIREMAEQAKLSVEDLAEVAIYNLIALWANEKKPELHDETDETI